MQRIRWFNLLLAIALPTLFLACDESESTLGGSPGGQSIAQADSIPATATAGFHRPQQMVAASRQTVGHSDSLGLESVLLMRLDYQPFAEWSPAPVDTPDVVLSFKMDHSKSLAWFPQVDLNWIDQGDDETARYLDLELILLQDSLGYDSLDWEDAFTGSEPSLAVLDRVSFRVTSGDTAFGGTNYTDPLLGRRTYRPVPKWWFNDADASTRWLMVRALPGQQGFMPVLAAGYASELRPGLRFSSLQIDSILVGNEMVPDTSWDTTFVAATWQTSLIRDASAASRLALSTGWAGQLVTVLPPFPPDSTDELYDPLVSTLSEAWLKVPLGGPGFNSPGAKVNLYYIDHFDSLGLAVEASQLIATDFVTDSTRVLEFNLTPHLRRIWVEDDTLSNADPIALALKLDDYNLLQLRQIGLASPATDPPRLVYRLSKAPDGWGRP